MTTGTTPTPATLDPERLARAMLSHYPYIDISDSRGYGDDSIPADYLEVATEIAAAYEAEPCSHPKQRHYRAEERFGIGVPGIMRTVCGDCGHVFREDGVAAYEAADPV